jgi:serine/threonine protein kinase
MTADLPHRLSEIGALLAVRMPRVFDATLALLETLSPVLDVAGAGRYEIQRPIGHGGHAEVLLGIVRGADGFERPVAIKRMRTDQADPVKLVALIEEAHHAARLAHPNVVSVLDLARDAENRPYLVMEHVDGIDLATLIETGPLPHPVAIFVVRELLSGLGYIHEERDWGGRPEPGIVHRDIKPSNVLLSWEGAVKLADFGLARMIQRPLIPGANAREGTPGYLSPEQARREDLDGRSDLYAVGIVLWELLASRRLRAGLPGDTSATITFATIQPPSEHRPVPADLEAVAMRLLAYDPAERHPTAELAARGLVRCQDAPRDGRGDLVRLLDERFPRARRPGPFPRPLDPGSTSTARRTVTGPWEPMDDRFAPPPDSQRLAGMSDPSRQRRRWALAFVLLALVLGTTIALLVLR